MYQQGKDQNQYIYTDLYGVPMNPQPITTNKPNQHQRQTMPLPKYAVKTEMLNHPNNYNINTGYDNKKLHKSTNLAYDNQYLGEEFVDETYVIDPNTGKKIIIESKNNTMVRAKNNPKHIAQNETYTIDPKTGQKIQLPNMIFETNNNPNTNTYIYHDLTSSIDPTLESMQRKRKSQEIAYKEGEKYNINATVSPQQGYGKGTNINNDMNSLDPKKSVSLLSVSKLANIPYREYPAAEFSKEPFLNIAGYGYNSYNGKVKSFNEDRVKAIVNYHLKKNVPNVNISYFGIFDGHSGNKCSDFLKEHLDEFLFNSRYFPLYPHIAIKESFQKAEQTFKNSAYDSKNNILLDKSGSCALVMLIINDILYAINLGDSRALYSYDTGKYIYQITRDHKPNDEVERTRIEKAGGKVFYANKVTRNGREIELKEEDFGKGFTFPYRISPGKIAVSLLYNI